MNILQVSAHFPPHIGGVETHVMELSKHLALRGHNVEVVTTTPSSSSLYQVKTCPTYFTILGNPVLKGVRSLIDDDKFDVVHLHTPPQIPVFQVASACKALGTPVVLTHHCDGEVSLPFLDLTIPLYMSTLGEMTYSRVERVIATSQSYADTSPYLRSRTFTVVPSGVDTDRFNPDVSSSIVRRRHGVEGRLVVGFVGRLVRHKGLDMLLEAVSRLTVKDVTCMVVGDGYMRENLEEAVRRLGMDNTVFTGWVSDDDLPHYYSAFDVFVLPSLSREEAFGGCVIEAMSSGTPVLVSNIPGPDEVVGEGCGMYFQKGNVEDILEKLNKVLEDRGSRVRMGRLAREHALRMYDWKIIAEKIEDVYREVTC